MSSNKMSAKDIAFESERVKFRHEVRNLKYANEQKDKQIQELTDKVREQEEQLVKLNEWIERLLEYTELSKEDLKNLIESENKKTEVRERISITLGIISDVYRRTSL